MKLTNFLNSAIIIACIALIPEIAGAQLVNTNNNSGQTNLGVDSNVLPKDSTSANYLQPFNTAFLAYQGYLKEQGVPSGSALVSEYQIGNLTAKDVVQAAIKANKLPDQFLNDPSYINAVDLQLRSFGDSSD